MPINHTLGIKVWILILVWFLPFSVRTWANSPQYRWATTTRGSTPSGLWSVLWSATRSLGTRTSKNVLRGMSTTWLSGNELHPVEWWTGFHVDGGWGRVWMMAVWRGSWWESWWPPAQRMMKGCVAHPRCSSPLGWSGGLLPSRQTANQVSSLPALPSFFQIL